MAPWGGTKPVLGNNPFAVAIPALKNPPVVLDMAMSVAAGGKIMLAAKTGESIPDSWALDTDGRPTTDPRAALKGTVRPVGDYKGYGLSLVIGMIAGILTGAAFGEDVTDLYEDLTRPQNVGHLMQAIDISRFAETSVFRSAVDNAIGLMRSAPRAGIEQILVPGEREYRLAREQRSLGISYSNAIVRELDAVAAQLSVERLAP
jgi:LDH2 family malate/lactate/ureidoglycolate dehydrogenase